VVVDTPEMAVEKIRRLDLPEVFARVWVGSLPPPLNREWQMPRTYFRLCLDLAARVARLDGLCPLFEVNGEAIVGVVGDREFVRLYYEDAAPSADANRAVEVLGENYQQFATQVLVEWEDSGSTDEFGEVAQLLEYRYAGPLRAILDAYDNATGEAQLQAFKASVS